MINKIILVGRLGNDPELKFTASGNSVTNFSIATNDGTKENPQVNWHRIVVFGKQAEVCSKHLAKGRLVYVEGRIQYRQFTDKEGISRQIAEVIASKVQFLDKNGGTKTDELSKSEISEEPKSTELEYEIDENDLPF